MPLDPIEAARRVIVEEVDDHLSWNVRAYGKAWTGEGEDTDFIVARAAPKAIEAFIDALGGMQCWGDGSAEEPWNPDEMVAFAKKARAAIAAANEPVPLAYPSSDLPKEA